MKRILLATLLAACTSPRTELIVGIATDLRATNELDSVHLTLSVEDIPFHEEDWTITGAAGADFNLPGSFGIFKDGDHDRVQIKLTGMRNGAPVVVREAVLGFIDGKTSFYRMGITSSCMANTCPAGQTCVEGTCKALELDGTMFPSFEAELVTTLTCSTPGAPNYLDTATGTAMPLGKDAAMCPGSLCAEGTCLVPPSSKRTFKGVIGGPQVIDLTVDGSKLTATMHVIFGDTADKLTIKCNGTIDGAQATAITCDQGFGILSAVIEGNRITGVAHSSQGVDDQATFVAITGSDLERYCGTFTGDEDGSWSFVTGGGIVTGTFNSAFLDGLLEGTLNGNRVQMTFNGGATASGTAIGTVSSDRSSVTGQYNGTAQGSPIAGTFTNDTGSCADRL